MNALLAGKPFVVDEMVNRGKNSLETRLGHQDDELSPDCTTGIVRQAGLAPITIHWWNIDSMSAVIAMCSSRNRRSTPHKLFSIPLYLSLASMTICTFPGLFGFRTGWCGRNHCFFTGTAASSAAFHCIAINELSQWKLALSLPWLCCLGIQHQVSSTASPLGIYCLHS